MPGQVASPSRPSAVAQGRNPATRDMHAFSDVSHGKTLRLQVYIRASNQRFWVLVDNSKRVSELKTEIDRQRVALEMSGNQPRGRSQPTYCTMLQDDDGFALPDDVRIGQLLKDGNVVRATVHESKSAGALGRGLGEDWTLANVMQQWAEWQQYTSRTILGLAKEAARRFDSAALVGLIDTAVEVIRSTTLRCHSYV